MTMITTGRTLDKNGQPIEGTGFTYNSHSRLAELLSQRISPIYSRPTAGEWFFQIPASDPDKDYYRAVGIARAGNQGPPEHVHIGYDEYVEIIQGTFLLTMNGKKEIRKEGAHYIIPKGAPHTVSGFGEGFAVATVETRPAVKFDQIIRTLYGLDHEGQLGEQGQLKFLQAMPFSQYFADDTVFTSPPPAVAVPLAKLLTPLARLAGYQATYARYHDEAFWHARVEQPQTAPQDINKTLNKKAYTHKKTVME